MSPGVYSVSRELHLVSVGAHQVPKISLSDRQNANFLWERSACDSDNASEESGDDLDSRPIRPSSQVLRRSDYMSKDDDGSESMHRQSVSGGDLEVESSQIGYIFSAQDTQEILQTDSSSWTSEDAAGT